MYKTYRLLRRSRFILLLILAITLIFPKTTVKSSGDEYFPPPAPQVVLEEQPIMTEHELIMLHVEHIAKQYNLDPSLIRSVIEHESNFKVEALGDSGKSFGLMQIQKRWHLARMERLGVTDLMDPYSNILVGVDYLAELINTQKDLDLALMVYNMGPNKASSLYNAGKISRYATSIQERARVLRTGGI